MKIIISKILKLYFRFAFFSQVIWTLLIFLVFVITVLILSQRSDVATEPVGWEKSYQLSPYKIQAKNIESSSRGNFVAAVYEGNSSIYASVSFDGGLKFLAPVKVAEYNPLLDSNPHVAVSGDGVISIVWHSFVEKESMYRIFYSISTDMGAHWSESKQLNFGCEMEMLPRIYYDNKNILHIFFHAQKEGFFNLFHAYSDNGKDFISRGALIRLSKSMKGAFFPSIYISKNNFFIVWQVKGNNFLDDLFFIRSTNYGGSWTSIKKITNSRGSNAAPAVVLHKDILYLVYQNNDDKNWGIKLLRGLDKGDRWIEEPLSVTSTNANCYMPKLTVADGDILIVWYDSREGISQIYSRKYIIRDKNFSDVVKLSVRKFPAKNPSITAAGKKVVVFWEEGSMIMAKCSDVHVEPPVVFSYTHPLDRWSRSAIAQIQWTIPRDESGIAGFAAIIDKNPYTNPPLQNIKAHINRRITDELDDGIHYFHIRSIDGAGNSSRTIHYKLQVSANPLPMPIIVSPTHPENESSASNSPIFRWAVDDTERLKGFVYSLSKDTIKKPDKFITDFEFKIDNLDEGNYFFNIGAVDKSNQVSQIASYYFIIGKAERIDLDKIKRLARLDDIDKHKIIARPYIFINFPFDTSKIYDKSSFDALIVSKNINPDQVLGYSAYIDNKKNDLPDKINFKKNILHVKDLKNGDYYIGVKCKYYTLAQGKKIEFWTNPVFSKITVKLFSEKSPLEYEADKILDKLYNKFGIVLFVICTLSISIVFLQYGTKLAFYLRLLQFKIKNFSF